MGLLLSGQKGDHRINARASVVVEVGGAEAQPAEALGGKLGQGVSDTSGVEIDFPTLFVRNPG